MDRGTAAEGRAGLCAALALAALGLSATLAAVVWSCRRGFDITDNGYYLLSAAHPEDVSAALTSAQRYARLVLLLSGNDIFLFRVIPLVALVAAALALGWRLGRLLPQTGSARLQSALLATLCAQGALLYFSWTLYGVSYNAFAAIVLLLAALCWLGILEAAETARGKPLAAWGAAFGACLGFCFAVRFPTAVSAAALFAIAAPALCPQLRRSALSVVVSILSGAALFFALHFALVEPFAAAVREWRNGAQFAALLGTRPAGLLHRYAADFSYYGSQLVRFGGVYALLAVMLALALAGWVRARYRPSIAALAFGVLALAFTEQAVRMNYYLGGDEYLRRLLPFYAALCAVLAGILLVVCVLRAAPDGDWRRESHWRRAGMAAVLLVLPFAGMIGTGNQASLNLLLHAAPWFALLGGLVLTAARVAQTQWITLIGTTVLTSFSVAQVVTGGEVSPYRLNAPLSHQDTPASIGEPPSELLVDPSTADFLRRLEAVLADGGFRPGDDLLAFYNMPGLVYAAGGRSPGGAWYNSGYPGSQAANRFLLAQATTTRIRHAFVLLKGRAIGVRELLSEQGMDLDRDYLHLGRLVWPVTGEIVDVLKPGGESGKRAVARARSLAAFSGGASPASGIPRPGN